MPKKNLGKNIFDIKIIANSALLTQLNFIKSEAKQGYNFRCNKKKHSGSILPSGV